MLIKRDVDEVIIQGDYMSGDRNTIASALRVHERLGVVILAPEGNLKTALELQSLYKSAAGANRVAIHQVRLMRRNSEDAVKADYKAIDRYVHGKGPCPRWIDKTVATNVRLQSATYGTRVVAGKFEHNAVAARDQLRVFWRLDQVVAKTGGRTQDLQPAVNAWLVNKGFREDRSYVFLFTKQAGWSMKADTRRPDDRLRVAEDRYAEKAHHFTSILTWRVLQERISRETSVIPVATGDDIGLVTTPTMVTFWEKDDWKKLLANVAIDQRSAQLGMWCYLAERFKGVSIIGMRSGMIEVPALLGIRTLYLEEKHNQQATRMARWIGTVPTFERQIVNTPPGIKQQVYWKEQSLRTDPRSVTYQHAVAQGGHLAGLAMGFSSKGLAEKKPGTLDSDSCAKAVATAVFGRGGLAPQISAGDFQLQASEFDSIIEWVKNTPKPAGATDAVHGSVVPQGPGGAAITSGTIIDCKRRDEIHQALMSERNIKKWSDFFASSDYLKSIGIGS